MDADKQTLLIEIGTEELPPASIQLLTETFAAQLTEAFDEVGIEYGAVHAFHSPRRIGFQARDVASCSASRVDSRKGPAMDKAFDDNGVPTKAALGFARSCGVEVRQLETVETDKGRWLCHHSTIPGQSLERLIGVILDQALVKLPVVRPMRWGNGVDSFVRPVHWLVLLHGSRILPWQRWGLQSDRYTHGHRVHCPEPLVLEHADDYLELLRAKGYVLASPEERRNRVIDCIDKAAAAFGGHVIRQQKLLDDINGIVEWPVALGGRFEERFLALPAEVLHATLQGHQRCFPVYDHQNRLMPSFIGIANIESTHPEVVRRGYERVIRPRLSDAEFFWHKDLQTGFESMAGALDHVVFQERLGAMSEKCARISHLCASVWGGASPDAVIAAQAAYWCKADLVSQMVGEFPELQGVMGGYYAKSHSLPDALAQAITEHYRPRHAFDELPVCDAGRILAVADRLDTLCGYFAIGEPPTGDKDPFALRRGALAIVRIALAMSCSFDIRRAIIAACAEQKVKVSETTEAEVERFIWERFRGYAREQNKRHDVTDAVLACAPRSILDAWQRMEAIETFLILPEARSLSGADKRIGNLLKQYRDFAAAKVDPALFSCTQERELWVVLVKIREQSDQYAREGQYEHALRVMAKLRAPVDAFFDQVLVITDDEQIRNNRLAVLEEIRKCFLRVAEIGRLNIEDAG